MLHSSEPWPLQCLYILDCDEHGKHVRQHFEEETMKTLDEGLSNGPIFSLVSTLADGYAENKQLEGYSKNNPQATRKIFDKKRSSKTLEIQWESFPQQSNQSTRAAKRFR